MFWFVLRRLGQSVVTILSVMILTFLLFRVIAGDIASAHVGQKATLQERRDWMRRHGYDRPWIINVDRQLEIVDKTRGPSTFAAKDTGDGKAAEVLGLVPHRVRDKEDDSEKLLVGGYVTWLSRETAISKLTGGQPLLKEPKAEPETPRSSRPAATRPDKTPAAIKIGLSDGTALEVDVGGLVTCGALLDRINLHADNRGRVQARISTWSISKLLDTQFADHLWKSVTFQARSLETNEKLTEIIAERAPKSLALTVPTMALGWLVGLVISCFVAYYRGTLIDKVGVFLSVLGMCVPLLAFMIYGQWLMFKIAPTHAYGLAYRSNVYIPVLIMVIAGLGSSVRFYRTVILDETNRDYVRTARAKGLPVATVLFRHVLKNCMLPILTNLIMAIPFLMLGSLLLEGYFGIPGLGDMLLSSINNRDEPIMSAVVFLTALIYTIGLLITDVSYAVFDPRIRLQ